MSRESGKEHSRFSIPPGSSKSSTTVQVVAHHDVNEDAGHFFEVVEDEAVAPGDDCNGDRPVSTGEGDGKEGGRLRHDKKVQEGEPIHPVAHVQQDCTTEKENIKCSQEQCRSSRWQTAWCGELKVG